MVGASPQDGPGVRPNRASRGLRNDGAHHGRERNGQGARRKAMHARSAKTRGPSSPINCAAMPEHLLESELFGHVKGAFTDARQSRQGLFLKATGGTLFLDEIGEMPAGMQAKLLRALQERTVRAVGGDTEIPFDTRILAATNRDLGRRGRREAVPRRPLLPDQCREHRGPRASSARARHPDARQPYPGSGTAHRAARAWLHARSRGRASRHSWPGNVRELQNCIERAVAWPSSITCESRICPTRVPAQSGRLWPPGA